MAVGQNPATPNISKTFKIDYRRAFSSPKRYLKPVLTQTKTPKNTGHPKKNGLVTSEKKTRPPPATCGLWGFLFDPSNQTLRASLRPGRSECLGPRPAPAAPQGSGARRPGRSGSEERKAVTVTVWATEKGGRKRKSCVFFLFFLVVFLLFYCCCKVFKRKISFFFCALCFFFKNWSGKKVAL